jgi:hypothetical protein
MYAVLLQVQWDLAVCMLFYYNGIDAINIVTKQAII